MDMMISSSSSSTAPSSALHHNHQHQQDAMGRPTEDATRKGTKQARQQQQQQQKPRPQQDEALKCPRCDSTNTKFCYYNNYSMSQPRYFCKACRRYWTQGGSLRNVPVGGGCRKNKRAASGSSSSLSSGSSSSRINDDSTQQLMMPAATTGFPNVLPTFMSTGFELPSSRDHHLSLPLAPLSLPNPPPALAPGGTGIGTGTTTSFLDILKGGFLDGSSSSNGMVMPFLPPSSLFGAMHHQHATTQLGAQGVEGGGAVKQAVTAGLQWPSSQHGGNINDGGGYEGVQQVAGDAALHEQQGSAGNYNVMMENSSNNNNGGPSSRPEYYWSNSNGGVPPGAPSSAPAAADPSFDLM